MLRNKGVVSTGVRTPIIREGDDLVEIVVNSVLNTTFSGSSIKMGSTGKWLERKNYDLSDRDVIGITESVIARAAGFYVTVDEIADYIVKNYSKKDIILLNPIYSRNRFSMILKAVARAADKQVVIYMPDFDEVGNPRGVNPFTGVDIEAYYREIVENEGKECKVYHSSAAPVHTAEFLTIYCGLHDYQSWKKFYGNEHRITLADICSDRNPDFGLLGTNKSTEEKLKLFPTKEMATKICEQVKEKIKEKTDANVYVCSYGDGCFKSLVGEIWECADPTTMPGYTNPEIFESTPNEIKIKAFADDEFKELSGYELDEAVRKKISEKNGSLVGNMASQGTTPRLYRDIIASIMDLTSGSGDKGTPVVLLQGYFDNYSD